MQDVGRHPQKSDDCATSSGRFGFYQETGKPGAEAEANREERPSEENSRSIWFGQLHKETANSQSGDGEAQHQTESKEATIQSPSTRKGDDNQTVDYLSTLPARQRELFRRIQQQQREPSAFPSADASPVGESNQPDEKWYSSDEEENGKSISDLIKREPDASSSGNDTTSASGSILPSLSLNALENINVAEIAKALSTLQHNQTAVSEDSSADGSRRDPRTRDPRMRGNQSQSMSASTDMGDVDLRVPVGPNRSSTQQQDVDLRLTGRSLSGDVDFRSGLTPLGRLGSADVGSSDIDLRKLGLAFQSSSTVHRPVPEIDASFDSHPPIEYRVRIVDYVPLDYSLIRVHADWAHLDPRQQKSFSGDSSVRDFTVSEPPSIPLGPASPDPTPPMSATTPVHGRHSDVEQSMSYNSYRPAANDPRTRDPRRSAAVAANASPVHSQTHMPEKRGLLGVAPPGMLPFVGRGHNAPSHDIPYDSYGMANAPYGEDRGYMEPNSGRDQTSRPIENRRDPRQRMRSAPIGEAPARSYTPPPTSDRSYR